MPNTRETLIELPAESEYMSFEKKADHLIANGVTVQEWISVKDRLPEKRDDVLLCRKWWGEISNPQMGWYNEVSGKWFDLSNFEICNVTHWMPLPEPPKEGCCE